MINESAQFRVMRTADFASFGVPVVAYIRRLDIAGLAAYGVYSADGEQLAIEASEDLAALSARQKNLLPVLVQ